MHHHVTTVTHLCFHSISYHFSEILSAKETVLAVTKVTGQESSVFPVIFFFLQHVVGKFYTLQAMTGKNCSKITSPPPYKIVCQT
jgi:hypothetical protein